jgi:hypothetical protein
VALADHPHPLDVRRLDRHPGTLPTAPPAAPRGPPLGSVRRRGGRRRCGPSGRRSARCVRRG